MSKKNLLKLEDEIKDMSKEELLVLKDKIKEKLENLLRLNKRSSKEYNFEDKSIEDLIDLYYILSNRGKINKFFTNQGLPLPPQNMSPIELRELVLNTFTLPVNNTTID
jgi:hypothetical protein